MINRIKGSFHVSKLFRYMTLGGVIILGAGCSDTNYLDLKEYIKDVQARPKGTIKPLPEVKIVEPFVFNPEGLRDPFKPLERTDDVAGIDIASQTGVGPDLTRRKEELELYSLDTLRMVGTLSMNSGLWALVKTSDGTIHRVQSGNYLGRRHGKIIRIMEDRIELDEIVSKPSGGWMEEQQTLVLAE